MKGRITCIAIVCAVVFFVSFSAWAGSLERRAFSALDDRDISMLQATLLRGANPNAKDKFGQSALFVAAASGNLDGVKILIDAGAKLEEPSKPQGSTPLIVAANQGYTDIVEALLNAGAKIAARTATKGSTALHQAAGEDHLGVAALLLKAGMDVDVRDGEGQTPLIRAAAGGKMAMTEFLLMRGAKIDLTDNLGLSALLTAAVHDQPAIVDFLLIKKAPRLAKLPEVLSGQAMDLRLMNRVIDPLAPGDEPISEDGRALYEKLERDGSPVTGVSGAPGGERIDLRKYLEPLNTKPSDAPESPWALARARMREQQAAVAGRRFRLVDRTMAANSLKLTRKLFTQAMLASSGEHSNFSVLHDAAVSRGDLLYLKAGTAVILTGKASGADTEIILPGFPGKWWVPNAALKDAGVPIPPNDIEYWGKELDD